MDVNRFNGLNADTELDHFDSVRVSISAGTMTWQDRSWQVFGSLHTPRGRFKLDSAWPGKTFSIPESEFFIPFRGATTESLANSNPIKAAARARGYKSTVFGIHKNNLPPNTIGAGCLLVSEIDLAEMAVLLPGATIVITD